MPPFLLDTLSEKWCRDLLMVKLCSFLSYDQQQIWVIVLVKNKVKFDTVDFIIHTWLLLAKLVVTYMLVSDSVQPWICTFLCSYFYLCALELNIKTWWRQCTAKQHHNLFLPEAKQPKAFVLYSHVGNQNITECCISFLGLFPPAYIAYVCVIWCQMQMFICDSLLLHRI